MSNIPTWNWCSGVEVGDCSSTFICRGISTWDTSRGDLTKSEKVRYANERKMKMPPYPQGHPQLVNVLESPG